MNVYQGVNIEPTDDTLLQTKVNENRLFERRAVTFAAFISVGKCKTISTLCATHHKHGMFI